MGNADNVSRDEPLEPLPDGDEWLTTEQVASSWQRNPETIRRWIRDGFLPATRFPSGRGWLIRRTDVIEAFERGRKPGRPRKPAREEVSLPLSSDRVSLVED